MNGRTLVIALLLTSALAGCLDPSDAETAQDAPEATQSLDANATNLPPAVDLVADASNGTAPLNITFTLEASDADGDALNWTFDDGTGSEPTTGNGSALPATVNVTYLAGNWTATFTVSDGSNETVETFAVTVADAAEDAGEAVENATAAVDVPEPIVWEGTATNIDGICLVIPGEWLYYNAAYAGVWMYKAEGSTPDGSGMLTDWWTGDDRIGFEGSEGVIPAGSDNVAVCPELPAVPWDFTLTLYHPDYVFE